MLSEIANITLFSKITTIKSPIPPVIGEKPNQLVKDLSIITLMLKPPVKDIYTNLSIPDKLILLMNSIIELPSKEDLSIKLLTKLKLTVMMIVKTYSLDL